MAGETISSWSVEIEKSAESLVSKYLEFLGEVDRFTQIIATAFKDEGSAVLEEALNKLVKVASEKASSQSLKQTILHDFQMLSETLKKEFMISSHRKIVCPKCKTEPLLKSAIPELYRCLKCGTYFQVEACPTCPHTTYTIKEIT